MCLTYTVPTIHSNDDIPYLSYRSYIPHMLYIWNIITTPTTPTIHTIQNIHAIHTIPTLHRNHSIPILVYNHTYHTDHTYCHIKQTIPNKLTYHTYHPYNTNHSCHTFQTCHTRPTIHTIHTQHTIPHPHHTTGGRGGQYHTPTTPQGGGQCSATHPPHHRGGMGRSHMGAVYGTLCHGGVAGPGANIYIIFPFIIFPPMMFTSVSSVHPQSAQRRVEPLGAVWPLGWPRPGRWRPRPPCRQSQQSPTLRRAQSLGQRSQSSPRRMGGIEEGRLDGVDRRLLVFLKLEQHEM